jgi:hypothetical protein
MISTAPGRLYSSIHPAKRFALVVLTAGVCLLLAAPLPAQDFEPAHNRFGQPDFEGIWQVLDPAAHYDLEPHAARYGVPASTGFITDPPDGRIPYNENGLARRAANRADLAQDPIAHCYKPGVPHMMYLPFPLQIVQSENVLTIMSEYIHNTRFVFLNRADHFGEGELDLWNGDSVGHFEGNTLVTDVFNFHPDSWLDRSGNHAGGWTLRVNERFTLIDADTIRYSATVTDPEDFTQPWTLEVYLHRHKDPRKQLLEYECHAYADNALGEPELPEAP